MSNEENWYFICETNEVNYKHFKIVKINNLEVGIIKVGNNEYRVYKNSCPHRLGPICKGTISGTFLPSKQGEFIYDLEGRIIRCPWHRYEYYIYSGNILYSDLKLKLKSYEYKIIKNKIFIKLK